MMSLSPIVKAIVMSIGYPTRPRIPALCTTKMIHDVGLTREKKTEAITRVRWLERDLFDGGPVGRQPSRGAADAVIAELNQLRSALGWLQIDVDGRWRWPHDDAHYAHSQ